MENDVPPIRKIWLADDDPDDREIFEDAIKETLIASVLDVFSGGEALLAAIDSGQLPDILFLDINMPCNGFDCLKEIRQKRQLKKIPIIIFSSSGNPKDVEESYKCGANLFYRKPSSFKQLIEGLKSLLLMNWNDPFTITSSHYINHQFVPFTGR
ncbi:MAG: response regulator [Flavisolibacter sp.]